MLLTFCLRLICIALLLVAAMLLLDLPWRDNQVQRLISGTIAVSLALAGAYLGDFLSARLQSKPKTERSGKRRTREKSAGKSATKSAPERAAQQSAQERWQGAGVIRWYGTENYGFITSDEEGEEIFFHINDIPRNQRDRIRPLLQEGQAVRFEARQTERGWRAHQLQIVEEQSAGDGRDAAK